MQEILNLTDNDIEKILEDNYNFAREEFDIEKNAYSIEENINIEYNVEEQLFEMLDLCRQKMTEEKITLTEDELKFAKLVQKSRN